MNTNNLNIAPYILPEHISVFDESTQQRALITVKSIAGIYTESKEQHTKDSPTLLGVRFLYKTGQESFFYINENEYEPLLEIFNPKAVRKANNQNFDLLKDSLAKPENFIRSVYQEQVGRIVFSAASESKLVHITVKDHSNNILFKNVLNGFSSHQLDNNRIVVTINQDEDNYFEIQIHKKESDRLIKALNKADNPRRIYAFDFKFKAIKH